MSDPVSAWFLPFPDKDKKNPVMDSRETQQGTKSQIYCQVIVCFNRNSHREQNLKYCQANCSSFFLELLQGNQISNLAKQVDSFFWGGWNSRGPFWRLSPPNFSPTQVASGDSTAAAMRKQVRIRPRERWLKVPGRGEPLGQGFDQKNGDQKWGCEKPKAEKTRSREAKKPKSQEAKKPRSQEAKKPRSQEAKSETISPPQKK